MSPAEPFIAINLLPSSFSAKPVSGIAIPSSHSMLGVPMSMLDFSHLLIILTVPVSLAIITKSEEETKITLINRPSDHTFCRKHL